MNITTNKVILYEDSASFATQVRNHLEWDNKGLIVEIAANKERFLELLEETPKEEILLIILDKYIQGENMICEISKYLNDNKITHIILSSEKPNAKELNSLRKNKHCLNFFLKDSISFVLFQLNFAISDSYQHALKLSAITKARIGGC